MKTEFWLEKWQNQQTGFHKEITHPLLIEYIDKFQLQKGDTVFVPLCGKTLDMLWLNEQGYNVIGIEISDLAVSQFFNENNLNYKKSNDKLFNIYTYENITIYQGDFFNLTGEYLKDVRAVYDRAALIALPDELVIKYVNKLKQITPIKTLSLLITLEFIKTSGPIGPPFSTSDAKVLNLFKSYSGIELLFETDIIEREASFQSQGCQFVYERVYLISF